MAVSPPSVRRQAIAAANARAIPAEPLRWSDALAEAPWIKALGAAYETEFRRHYAERLVARGAATEAYPHRAPTHQAAKASGRGGKTDLERKTVYLTHAERVAQEAKAGQAGLSWSMWARRKLGQ